MVVELHVPQLEIVLQSKQLPPVSRYLLLTQAVQAVPLQVEQLAREVQSAQVPAGVR